MYDYLEDIGEDWRLDVVALCCDFTEHSIEYFENSEECEHLTQDDVVFEVRDFKGELISYVVNN